MPKVSIIIPNYNHARFLKKRMTSIIEQTFQDFEMIFLDDASTDNSMGVFAEYANCEKISNVIINDKNSGNVFAQWDRGCHYAKGEYIWIAETDDYASPEFLENMVEKLDKYDWLGMAYCQSVKVNEDGTLTGFPQPFKHSARWTREYINDGLSECYNYLLYANTIPNASAVVMRRLCYNKVGGVPLDTHLCGDWFLWVKILHQAGIYYSARVQNYFRTTSSSVRTKITGTKIREDEYFKIADYMLLQSSHDPSLMRDAAYQSARLWFERLLLGGADWRSIFKAYKKILSMYHSVIFICWLVFMFVLTFFNKSRNAISRLT
ncbi:MAG: glycosyltransferase family 2 protein [Candidatus Omnitrophica bacterium]|nr:glycosyltransferase family 2 protein [Candidatus Omnitrophota bacterium]